MTAIPMPEITVHNRPFWDGCAMGELRVQVCEACGARRFPESPVCPRCLATAAAWRPVSGHGRVWSWIRMHQKYLPAFADQLPYIVLFVDLDEGPRLVSGMSGDADGLQVGSPVDVVFEPLEDRVVPRFRVSR